MNDTDDNDDNGSDEGSTTGSKNSRTTSCSSIGSSSDEALMVLLETERRLARQLKETTLALCVSSSDNGDDGDSDSYYRDFSRQAQRVTDFEYVQFAMVMLCNSNKFPGVNLATGTADEETAKQAVDRILRLQYFRDEYDVANTVQQGVEMLQAFMEQQPQFLLHLDRHYMDSGDDGGSGDTDVDDDDDDDDEDSDNQGQPQRNTLAEHAIPRDCRTCVMVGDVARFDWAAATANDTAFRTFLVARYYHLQAVNPHFAAMRQGCLFVFEMEGLGWDQYLLMLKLLKKMWTELMQAYPSNFKAMQYYHTPSVANMVFSMLKHVYADHVGSKVQWGLRLEPDMAALNERMSDIFASATMESLLERGTSLLEERAFNEDNFTL